MNNGTAKGLGLKNTISAGKTGTTDERRTGGLWIYLPLHNQCLGYDMPKTLEDLKGASYPGYIWNKFMEQIH